VRWEGGGDEVDMLTPLSDDFSHGKNALNGGGCGRVTGDKTSSSSLPTNTPESRPVATDAAAAVWTSTATIPLPPLPLLLPPVPRPFLILAEVA